jgi:hypothetical protein
MDIRTHNHTLVHQPLSSELFNRHDDFRVHQYRAYGVCRQPISVSTLSYNIENMERGMYLLTRPPRQTPLHPHHSARDLIANTRLAAMMMVHGCSCSSRASVVSPSTCRGGGCAMTMPAVTSYLCLVGFVSRIGTLEACHEGWFCGAGCAGAAAEHFDVFVMDIVRLIVDRCCRLMCLVWCC